MPRIIFADPGLIILVQTLTGKNKGMVSCLLQLNNRYAVRKNECHSGVC